ncbi:DNA helicase PcrA [Weissella koreensis]|uniref:ATP-dependent DNA helicase n=1 Tax=Weissella koreensis TaxID=165096 RepID=A0A7H1MN72_9LACO|nr:DNA helicase PcrA [Weissella koreensis]AVH75706.1 DNA helicase PcrA [Weissella koreensis]QGN20927.1 DNA helicase PcrA [Weissella koreensis]QNT64908.1 DNA helicase PcrA [Weissella koreensis]
MSQEMLRGMNPQQAEAVTTTEGPLLIMAGAGSGKTRVLTHRVAHLIKDKNVAPWRILAITFTNKAAREMKERIADLIGAEDADRVWVSTFHAMAVRILRRDIDKLGYKRDFTIIDAGTQRTLVKRILKDQNVDIEKFDLRSVLSAISNAKNAMETPVDYAKTANDLFGKIVAKAYAAYQKQLGLSQSVDFDDLIMLTIELLEQEPEVLQYYQDKFQYIHVDEYQDTNDAQYRLIQLLADGWKNLAVVGDSDQSIYGWRGANLEIILNFEKDYVGAKKVLLEQNYRSTQTILNAANEVIANNNGRITKNLWTENGDGEKITYHRSNSDRDEAVYILGEIANQVKNEKRQYRDFAILYRTNAQSRGIEEALVKANIPYTMVGGSKFYDRKEIRDILAYFSLLTNPADDESFLRVVNEPKRGLGDTSIIKLRAFASEHNWPLLEAAANANLMNDLQSRAQNKFMDFAALMQNLIQQEQFDVSITDLARVIYKETNYVETLKASPTPENENRLENLDEFLTVTEQFDKNYVPDEESVSKYVDFMSELALVSDIDNVDEDDNNVTLMTLHAAKGLEFPVVFLVGMEESIFPSFRAIIDPKQLDEERRLAYVGITRAKEKLYLTNAYTRMLYGKMNNNMPSRFIDEISPKYLDLSTVGQLDSYRAREASLPFAQRTQSVTGTTFQGRQAQPNQRTNSSTSRNLTSTRQVHQAPNNTTSDEQSNWAVGDLVSHKKWGTGTVVKVNGLGEDMELDVAFASQGIKRLLAAFAPIKKQS